jgi:hypothetical protein
LAFALALGFLSSADEEVLVDFALEEETAAGARRVG